MKNFSRVLSTVVAVMAVMSTPAYADAFDDACAERDKVFERLMANGCESDVDCARFHELHDWIEGGRDHCNLMALCKKRDQAFAAEGNLDLPFEVRQKAQKEFERLCDEIRAASEKCFHENTAKIFETLGAKPADPFDKARDASAQAEKERDPLHERSLALQAKQKKVREMWAAAMTDADVNAAEALYKECEAESRALTDAYTKVFEQEAPALQGMIDEINKKAQEFAHPTAITYVKAYTYCAVEGTLWIPKHLIRLAKRTIR